MHCYHNADENWNILEGQENVFCYNNVHKYRDKYCMPGKNIFLLSLRPIMLGQVLCLVRACFGSIMLTIIGILYAWWKHTFC